MNEEQKLAIRNVLLQKGRKFEICKEVFSKREIQQFSAATLYKKLLLLLDLNKEQLNDRSFRKWHAKEKGNFNSSMAENQLANKKEHDIPSEIVTNKNAPNQSAFQLTDPTTLHRDKQTKYLNLNNSSND